MPKSSLTLEILKEAVRIKEQIAEYEAKLEKLLGGAISTVKDAVLPALKRGRRKMSTAARARIAAAKKEWWARHKSKPTAPATKPVGKKRKLSTEGRARIVAGQKKRWAAKRK